MNIKETKLINCVEVINNASLGRLYFYDNVVISEINEGAHVSLDVGEEHTELIQNHFGDKPFIYLSNRVNEFSTNAIDFEKFCNIFPDTLTPPPSSKTFSQKRFGTLFRSSLTPPPPPLEHCSIRRV